MLDSANVVSENGSPSTFLELAARKQKSAQSTRKTEIQINLINSERFKSPLTKREKVSPFLNFSYRNTSVDCVKKDLKPLENANRILPKTEVAEDPLPILDSFIQQND